MNRNAWRYNKWIWFMNQKKKKKADNVKYSTPLGIVSIFVLDSHQASHSECISSLSLSFCFINFSYILHRMWCHKYPGKICISHRPAWNRNGGKSPNVQCLTKTVRAQQFFFFFFRITKSTPLRGNWRQQHAYHTPIFFRAGKLKYVADPSIRTPLHPGPGRYSDGI